MKFKAVTISCLAIAAATAAPAQTGQSVAELERRAAGALLSAGFASVDYVAVRRADDLAPFAGDAVDAPARILAAAWLGKTRLIDNMAVAAPS